MLGASNFFHQEPLFQKSLYILNHSFVKPNLF